jgi:hypothetical protein
MGSTCRRGQLQRHDAFGLYKPGYNKIRFCGEQARRDGLEYFWIDTCCIDKSSSTELQDSRLSVLCFAGTVMPINATCIFRMSRAQPWTLTTSPVSCPGNHLFGGAGGSPGDGPFKSLLLRRWLNSTPKRVNNWVIRDL